MANANVRRKRRQPLPAEKIAFRVAENPRPVDDVLESLADLLIDIAELDGSIRDATDFLARDGSPAIEAA